MVISNRYPFLTIGQIEVTLQISGEMYAVGIMLKLGKVGE